MRIAFLIQEISPNAGQTNTIAQIIDYLSHKDEIQIDIFSKHVKYPLLPQLINRNINVIEIQDLYSSIIFKKKLGNKLKSYDLIYIKGSYPYVFPASYCKKPTILVVHQIDPINMGKNLNQKIRLLLIKLITSYVLKKPTQIVTVSEELRQYYKNRYGINAYLIEDQISPIFYTEKQRLNVKEENAINLLSVGYWDGDHKYSGRKRHDILLYNFYKALSEFPKMKIHLVGLNRENIIEIKKLPFYDKISSNTKMSGFMDEQALLKEYLNNDIYVTATSYEGFYRQIVEAFATGMPALVFDSRILIKEASACASVNHILKSEAGTIYKDSDSFINGIREILKNYTIYSKNAIIYSRSFSYNTAGDKTYLLIKKLINKY